MKVRDLINSLLDFPLDSDVCIENGYGDDSYDIMSIDFDSESNEGWGGYSVTTIHFSDVISSDDYSILEHDFMGEVVNKDFILRVYDEDNDEFCEMMFDEDSLSFKRV